jgi:hypothetical protein
MLRPGWQKTTFFRHSCHFWKITGLPRDFESTSKLKILNYNCNKQRFDNELCKDEPCKHETSSSGFACNMYTCFSKVKTSKYIMHPWYFRIYFKTLLRFMLSNWLCAPKDVVLDSNEAKITSEYESPTSIWNVVSIAFRNVPTKSNIAHEQFVIKLRSNCTKKNQGLHSLPKFERLRSFIWWSKR